MAVEPVAWNVVPVPNSPTIAFIKSSSSSVVSSDVTVRVADRTAALCYPALAVANCSELRRVYFPSAAFAGVRAGDGGDGGGGGPACSVEMVQAGYTLAHGGDRFTFELPWHVRTCLVGCRWHCDPVLSSIP